MARRRGNPTVLGRRFDVSKPDVLGGRHIVVGVILENDPDVTPQGLGIEVTNVDTIDRDRPSRRIVETTQEFDQRRFTGTVVTHDRYALAWMNGERDVLKDLSCPGWVLEADVVEDDACT